MGLPFVKIEFKYLISNVLQILKSDLNHGSAVERKLRLELVDSAWKAS
jgi:hypothetical protein